MTTQVLLDTPILLMALLPHFGPRAPLASTRAVLKWAPARPLVVALSTLEFLNDNSHVMSRRDGAFGLARGRILDGPVQLTLDDETRRPAGATRHRWQLNDWVIEAPMVEAEADGLRATWLPLLLPLRGDVAVITELVNDGQTPLDLVRGVQQARLWADDVAWERVMGRAWDGRYLVPPGHAVTRRFALHDFPGVPTSGEHEMMIELLGRRSSPARVHWHGTPWSGMAVGSGTVA